MSPCLTARWSHPTHRRWRCPDMIVKVKEPQAVERKMLRKGQLLFTYLHLAPDPDQTRDLLASGCTAIAYETVTDQTPGIPRRGCHRA